MYRQSKKLLKSNISSICPQNMVNFGPLMAEIIWWVWGTPVNFNGFRDFASLLHRSLNGGQPNFARCLAVSWPVTLCIYFRRLLPLTEFARCKIQLASKSAFCYIGSVTTRHSSSRRQPNCGVGQGRELRNLHHIPQSGHHVGNRPTF